MTRATLMILTALLLRMVPSSMVFAGEAEIDKADTAWLMVSTALVMLMTPGLALFYGGMVRKKNDLAPLCTVS
jgi:Amt family ammonium transporter